MQTSKLNLFLLFFIPLVISGLQTKKKSTEKPSIKADAVFKQKDYYNSLELYHSMLLTKGSSINPSTYLKLAFIHEKMNNVPEALYYLSKYNEKNPSSKASDKIATLAEINNLRGYKQTDLVLIYQYFKQFYILIIAFFLLIASFISVVLISKYFKNEPIQRRYKITLFLYIVILFLVVNFPFNNNFLIVKKKEARLRDEPSAAGAISEIVYGGEKFNYIGKKDIWLRIYLNNSFYYIKRDDVWILN